MDRHEGGRSDGVVLPTVLADVAHLGGAAMVAAEIVGRNAVASDAAVGTQKEVTGHRPPSPPRDHEFPRLSCDALYQH